MKSNAPILASLFALSLAANVLSAEAPKSYTYPDLVDKMIDLEALALRPEPGEQTGAFTSYNRASQYDETTGKYVDWGMNGDYSGFLRMEGEKKVVAEAKGPGVIWRVMNAVARNRDVEIYIDDAAEPVVSMPLSDYYKGSVAPFDFSRLSYRLAPVYNKQGKERGAGHNLYVPIPFQESIKIVGQDKGAITFHHITHNQLPEGTKVPSFTGTHSPEARASLEKINGYFENGLGEHPDTFLGRERAGTEVVEASGPIAAGDSLRLNLEGSRAITALRVKPKFGSAEGEAEAALRELVLQISWDGEENPSVWSPLGDFFGTTPGINLYRSVPLGMTEDGFYAYWFMPFAKSATVEIINEGNQAYDLDLEITHAPLDQPIEQYLRFHAKWHRGPFAPTEPGRAMDWTVLKTTGQGRFVGFMFHVWTPNAGWWGEGDEKFYVDGEKFPSTFGIGSEDYFGYAWCRPNRFQKAFHNQTSRTVGFNKGNNCVARWLIADNIPFQESFFGTIETWVVQPFENFDLEKWKKQEATRERAALAVWYLSPDGEDPYRPVSLEERTEYYDVTFEPAEPGELWENQL